MLSRIMLFFKMYRMGYSVCVFYVYVYMYMYLGYVFYFRDGVILYPKYAAFGILDFGMRIQEAK